MRGKKREEPKVIPEPRHITKGEWRITDLGTFSYGMSGRYKIEATCECCDRPDSIGYIWNRGDADAIVLALNMYRQQLKCLVEHGNES